MCLLLTLHPSSYFLPIILALLTHFLDFFFIYDGLSKEELLNFIHISFRQVQFLLIKAILEKLGMCLPK